nr:amino-terminal enhancer of split-like isoform X2 [Aotus nancymaae]
MGLTTTGGSGHYHPLGSGASGSPPRIRRNHCLSPLPHFQHQQQVLGAIERAKQVTAPELNSIIRQLQAHQLSQLQALALPLTPLPVGLQPPSLPAVSAGTGLLSLSALGSQAHLSKEDKNGHDGDAHQEDDGEKSD